MLPASVLKCCQTSGRRYSRVSHRLSPSIRTCKLWNLS